MDTRRLVASNPANFARLEVKDDDFRRRIALQAGETSTVLYLGGSGGANTVYVRRADEDEVYLGSGLSSWELSTQVSTWLDANYVNAPVDDLLEIKVQRADGSFTFLREGDDWTYAGLSEGEVFEDTRMPLIARNAATVRLQEPLGLEALDDYGLDEPPVVVDVRYRQLVEAETDGTDEPAPDDELAAEPEYTEAAYTLTFGATMADGNVVLKSSDADYYRAGARYRAQRLHQHRARRIGKAAASRANRRGAGGRRVGRDQIETSRPIEVNTPSLMIRGRGRGMG